MASKILQSRLLFQPLSTESGGESWTPIHGVFTGGAASERVASHSLRRSDDHAAAGDMRERTGIARSKRPKPLRHVIMRAEAARETLRLP